MSKNYQTQMLLDLLEDVADSYGVSPEEYLNTQLEKSAADRIEKYGEVPEEVKKELEYALSARKAERKNRREKENEAKIGSETEEFRRLFPDVKPTDIPAEVWDEVASGESLISAYAVYYCKRLADGENAEKSNNDAASRATSPAEKGESEPEFTREMVENMTDKEVKGNYRGIIASMKKWKI